MINRMKNYYTNWFQAACKLNDSSSSARLTFINMQRIRAIAFLLIFIMSGMVFFDMAAIGAVNKENYLLLRPWFISMRLLFILVSVVYVGIVKTPEHPGLISKKHTYYMESYMIITLVFMSAFTGLVQTIRDDISPYLMAIFFLSSFIYLNRRQSNLFFGLALLTMGIGTWLVQADKGIFVYNMINALLMTSLAWMAAQVLYANRIQEYQSQRLIEQQTAQLAKSNSYLEQLSYHDALTDLANRRYFEEYLHDEWSRAKEQGSPISLILADIDNFKELNDTFGHQVGDKYLRQVSMCLSAALNIPKSLVARLGGDEYAVVMPETDMKSAQTIADKMLHAVQELNQTNVTQINQPITISLGVSSSCPSDQDSLSDFFTEADNALYKAKKMGRNQVAI